MMNDVCLRNFEKKFLVDPKGIFKDKYPTDVPTKISSYSNPKENPISHMKNSSERFPTNVIIFPRKI